MLNPLWVETGAWDGYQYGVVSKLTGASGTALWPVADLKGFLGGRWRVHRSLQDRRHSILGEFRGQARFTPAGAALLYDEQGTVDFGGHRGCAEQRHRYDFDTTSARATVSFRDGRVFHALDLSTGEALVAHACGPDLYEGCFTVLGRQEWKSAWKVTGPRKDQELVTLFTRLP